MLTWNFFICGMEVDGFGRISSHETENIPLETDQVVTLARRDWGCVGGAWKESRELVNLQREPNCTTLLKKLLQSYPKDIWRHLAQTSFTSLKTKKLEIGEVELKGLNANIILIKVVLRVWFMGNSGFRLFKSCMTIIDRHCNVERGKML